MLSHRPCCSPSRWHWHAPPPLPHPLAHAEWEKGYAPDKAQAEADRQAAFAARVPHGEALTITEWSTVVHWEEHSAPMQRIVAWGTL